MWLILFILFLVVIYIFVFNVLSWDMIKMGCLEFVEGFKEGFFN